MKNKWSLFTLVLLPLCCSAAVELPEKKKVEDYARLSFRSELIERVTGPRAKSSVPLLSSSQKESNFLQYRHPDGKYDTQLLDRIVAQYHKNERLIPVYASIKDAAFEDTVPVEVQEVSRESFDDFLRRIASMVQWNERFRYAIPLNCIKVKS